MRHDYHATQIGGIANLALMARVKTGFVPGFEAITYAARLELLFKLVQAGRQANRESLLVPSPFRDTVGRWGIIQSFRYAVFGPDDEPESAGDPEPVHRVYLNVAFDGGWEPYLRVIYRDLGALLDAIFCNCVGYPLARRSSFRDYEAWVRAHEVDGGMAYTDSALTVADQRYLAEVERIQREERDPARAERRIAGLALPDAVQAGDASLRKALENPLNAINLALRSLRSLYALRRAYAPNAAGDDQVLLRFANDALQDFVALVRDRNLFNGLLLKLAGPAVHEAANQMKLQHATELDWLMSPLHDASPPPAPEHLYSPAAVQGGILEGYPGISHGSLVLLQVVDAGKAANALATLPWSAADGNPAPPPGQPRWNVALSWSGLQRLGLRQDLLDEFPQEFADGMEARAGLLGDVRSNHPDHWQRPTRNWGDGADGQTLELSVVHVVIQLRLADPDTPGPSRHSSIEAAIRALHEADNGLQVLSVQDMRSWREPAPSNLVRGHFGFVDGLSQPVLQAGAEAAPTTPRRWGGEVPRGEILLGYANHRDSATPTYRHDGLLLDGSFLVVRKLRQRVALLNRVLARQAATIEPLEARRPALKQRLEEQLMGRQRDGMPLADAASPLDNSFTYAADPHGQRCPMHSHVRRANPRTLPEKNVPRLMRRGMSYGPRDVGDLPPELEPDRGLVFMAYVASLAEQFEIVQRWIAGGNSSGVLSTPGDPFLGVPVPGEPRMFRWLQEDGHVVRVDLGSRPLVELQWGLYLFVPSMRVLQRLPALVGSVAKPARPPLLPPLSGSLDDLRRQLEDDTRRKAAWDAVRDQPGGRQITDYGLLLGCADAVLRAFADKGKGLSVRGYGQRLRTSIGLGYLGQDIHAADRGERALAAAVNRAIEKLDADRAYRHAREATAAALQARRVRQVPVPGVPAEVPIDVVALSIEVLGALCSRWFGVPDATTAGGSPEVLTGDRPDDTGAPAATCPGHLLSVSRYVFTPHPTAEVEAFGRDHGRQFSTAIGRWLQRSDAVPGELTTAILKAVDTHRAEGSSDADHHDLRTRLLAGVMLGFSPTVHGNFLKVMQGWIESRRLWDLQRGWRDDIPAADRGRYGSAERALQAALLGRMRESPVPEMLWRSATGKGPFAEAAAGDSVVIGIGSAMQDGGEDMLLFGGSRQGEPAGTHACPGYTMAMGVLLGMITSLFEAGTLRPTAGWATLNWVPPLHAPTPGG